MVKVFFSLSRERLSLAVQGHASFAPQGEDIVCAACSMLAATLCEMIQNGVKNGAFYAPPTLHLGKGDALLSCSPRADFYEEFLHNFYMAQVGFSLLAREYPDHVNLVTVDG